MAIGDTRGSGVRLRAVPPADVEDVRHFDQLGHREQDAFLQLYRGAEPGSVPFEAGDVVVFTEYFRVERESVRTDPRDPVVSRYK